MSTSGIKAFLFKASCESFLALLLENSIEFITHMPPRGEIENSGVTIEILNVVAPALCAVIVMYLKTRPSRKVIITTKDKAVIHAQGLSQSELQRVIALARQLTVETQVKET
jgi:hypothetical protein